MVGVRWIDTNKGFGNYRSRLVAQEFRTSREQALFAATPPLESLRVLLSLAASRGSGDDSGPCGLMLIDIKRAHFYAEAQRQIFIKLPQEDERSSDPNTIGLLKQSLYGTRDASSNWEKEYGRTLTKGGFTRGGSIAMPLLACFMGRSSPGSWR